MTGWLCPHLSWKSPEAPLPIRSPPGVPRMCDAWLSQRTSSCLSTQFPSSQVKPFYTCIDALSIKIKLKNLVQQTKDCYPAGTALLRDPRKRQHWLPKQGQLDDQS